VEGSPRKIVAFTPTIDLFCIVVSLIVMGSVVIGSVVATGNVANTTIITTRNRNRTTCGRDGLRVGCALRAVLLGLVGRWPGRGSKK